MANILQTVLKLIFDLLFGKPEEVETKPKTENAIEEPQNPDRPYVDYVSQKVGEVEITDLMFNDLSRTSYSLKKGIPNIWIKTKAIVSGSVDFTLFVDGNKDSINNPKGKTSTYPLNVEKIIILELPNGPTAREIGTHTVTIQQSYNSGRDDTTGETHAVYASKTFVYGVTE